MNVKMMLLDQISTLYNSKDQKDVINADEVSEDNNAIIQRYNERKSTLRNNRRK